MTTRRDSAEPSDSPPVNLNGTDLDESAGQATVLERTVAYPPAASVPALAQFGHYEILSEIARGGMGVVYAAIDRQLDRLVALKVIKSGELADADQIERFQTEAKAAAQLDHPGIVSVYEVGQFGDQHFMAMALIDGPNLWEEVKDSPLSPKRAAKLMQQVAEAVQYAHEHGIVHRDLKPQNILLTKDGQPKVTDFGLAKRQASDSSLTETGQLLGTPSYMPPEQAQGKVKQVGPQADVYSLGATLYCLLTGRPPFQAATQLETMLQVVEQDPVSPKSLNRAVSVDLETICLRCLEKDPAKRYATAAALANDLTRFLTGEPIQARPVGRLERVLKWIARKPMTAAAYGFSALTAVLTIVGLTIALFWRNAEVARQEAEDSRNGAIAAKNEADTARKEADTARIEAVDARRKTEIAMAGETAARKGEERAHKELEETKEYNEYLLNVRLAPNLWENGWVENARRTLDDCPPPLRNWEWKYFHRQFHPELKTLAGHPRLVTGIKLSPDNSILASSSGSEIRLWNTVTGELEKTLHLSGTVGHAFDFSPDGLQLVVGTDEGTTSSLTVWNVAEAKELLRLPHAHGLKGAGYGANGTRIASAGRDGAIRLWSSADMREIPVSTKHSDGIWRSLFTPDGQRLITVSWDLTAKVWDVVNGNELATLRGHTAGLTHLAVNPQGTCVATSSDDGSVKLWSLENFQELHSLRLRRPGSVLNNQASFDPTGRFIVTVTEGDKSPRVWDVRTGQLILTLEGHRSWCRTAKYSPDGSHIATGSEDGTVRIWDAATGKPLVQFMGHAFDINGVEFMADGTRLYSASGDATVKCWDATLRQADDIVPIEGIGTWVGEFTFCLGPDGKQFAWVSEENLVRIAGLGPAADVKNLSGHRGRVVDLKFSPDGTKVLTASHDGTAGLWEAASGKLLATLVGHSGPVLRACFSHDGSRAATASQDGTAKVWLVDDARELFTLIGHRQGVNTIAFSPDGARLATSSDDGTVRLWSTSDGNLIDEYRWTGRTGSRPPRPLVFSPHGDRLVAAQSNEARLWDVAKRREIALLEGHTSSIFFFNFDVDGARFSSTGWNNFIKVWDSRTGAEIATLKGHSHDVHQTSFSPDGRRLASASADHTIRLWDTSTWRELATLKGHQDAVVFVTFTSDGKCLISASADGTVRQWISEESPSELEERRQSHALKWRTAQLHEAENAGNWYAAVFHLDLLLRDRPHDELLTRGYEHALAKLKEQGVLPPPVSSGIKRTRSSK